MRFKSFKEAGLTVPNGKKRNDSIKTLCPQCSHNRVKSDELCVFVSFNKQDQYGKLCNPFKCYNCGFAGAVYEDGFPTEDDTIKFVQQPREYRKPSFDVDDYDTEQATYDWFADRGISSATVDHFRIKSVEYKFAGKTDSEPAMMFPFFKNGELINIQYRNLKNGKEKDYKSFKGGQPVFFNFDSLLYNGAVATDTLYITEGQVDAMSLYEVGYPFVLSVPGGSPFNGEGNTENAKLAYLDDPDFQAILPQIAKVVLVGDDDNPGRKLAHELATRIGVERSFKVRYPDGYKDANQVLMDFGKERLIEVIESAERMPIDGIVTVSQVRDQLLTLYNNGPDTGKSTGYDNLDKVFRVGLGKLIVITGIPESGKTRFLANIVIWMMKKFGIKVSAFTPESRPYASIVSKFIQIITGKPFSKSSKDRISPEELNEAAAFLDEHLTFVNPTSGDNRGLKALTTLWKAQLLASGTRYGILDPFNYIPRPQNNNEGDFVLQALTYLADWCVTNDFTLFVVVHPTKIQKNATGEYPVVGPYNIYGSSHWYNCADFILSIWRSSVNEGDPVQLHVLKAKQEELGTSHSCVLFNYDVATGVYTPYDNEVYVLGKGGKPVPKKKPSGYDANSYTDEENAFDENQEELKPFEFKPKRARKLGARV